MEGGGPKGGQGGLLGGGVAQTYHKNDRSWPDKWESVLSGHRGYEEDKEEVSATTSARNAKVRSSDFIKKLWELGSSLMRGQDQSWWGGGWGKWGKVDDSQISARTWAVRSIAARVLLPLPRKADKVEEMEPRRSHATCVKEHQTLC